MSNERYLEKFIENKKTRVPGKPRHFIDAYLDELEKVGCVRLFCFLRYLFVHFLVIPYFFWIKRGRTPGHHFLKTSFVPFFWIFTLLGLTQQLTLCFLACSTS